MAHAHAVTDGVLSHGLPYVAVGSGSPLVALRGFTTVNANPTGLQRRVEIRMLAPLARHFRVYSVGRAPGMSPGVSMAEVADQHADALREQFGGPVDVMGTSSGGSVALQLAADHPDVVRRLVLVSAGYRLGPEAQRAQLAYAEATAAGRRGAHLLAPFKVSSPLAARALAPLMWLLDPLTRPDDATDLLAFARAEDAFDLGDRLGDVRAPTLVIAGERDNVYSPEIFRRTADGVPDGRLVVYPRTGHGGAIVHRRLAADVTGFLTAA